MKLLRFHKIVQEEYENLNSAKKYLGYLKNGMNKLVLKRKLHLAKDIKCLIRNIKTQTSKVYVFQSCRMVNSEYIVLDILYWILYKVRYQSTEHYQSSVIKRCYFHSFRGFLTKIYFSP